MGISQIRLAATGLAAAVLILLSGSWSAVSAATDAEIVESLDATGRFLELSDGAVDGAADRANAEGIAFVWLDQNGDGTDADALAAQYAGELEQTGSRYRTVVVLLGEGFGASSSVYDQSDLNAALDASVDGFASGAVGRGLDTFTETIVGSLTTATTTGDGSSGTTSGDGGSVGGGGIGFGSVLLGIAAIGGLFFGFRAWSGGRKRKKQAAIDMEDDRAEIKEQLKNNADRVISLGDRAINSGDVELIATYEEASTTYQDVSQGVDAAATAEEVDALDDRIDHAEWQFEVIEAKLDGRPIPPSPEEQSAKDAEEEAAAEPPPPTGEQRRPRPGSEPGVVTSPRTGRRYPTPGSRRRRSGGGLGGGLVGGLGSILGSVILGGGLGGGNRSRRSRRRTGGGGFGMGGAGIGTSSGGLGGGVLRRGGGRSRSGSRSRSRSRSSGGGRSFGRSKSRGGRSF